MNEPLVPEKKYKFFIVDEAEEDEEEGTERDSGNQSENKRSPVEIAQQYATIKRIDQVLPESSINAKILMKSKSSQESVRKPRRSIDCLNYYDDEVKYDTASQEEEDKPEKQTLAPISLKIPSSKSVFEKTEARKLVVDEVSNTSKERKYLLKTQHTTEGQEDFVDEDQDIFPLMPDTKSPTLSKQLESFPSRSRSSHSSTKDINIDIMGVLTDSEYHEDNPEDRHFVAPGGMYSRIEFRKLEIFKNVPVFPYDISKVIEVSTYHRKTETATMISQASSPILSSICQINSTERLLEIQSKSRSNVKRNSTPNRQLTEGSCARILELYAKKMDRPNVEIKVPLYIKKREITPAPKKEFKFYTAMNNFSLTKASTLISSARDYSRKSVDASKHSNPAQKTNSPKPIYSTLTLCPKRNQSPTKKVPKLRFDISNSLEKRRGACNRLLFEVDMGDMVFNNHANDRQNPRSISNYGSPRLSRPRFGSIIDTDNKRRKQSINIVNVSMDRGYNGRESERSALNVLQREPLSDRYYFSTYNRDSHRSKDCTEPRRESAIRCFEEGIQQVRRASIRKKSNQRRSVNRNARNSTSFKSDILTREHFDMQEEMRFDPTEFTPAERLILSHRADYHRSGSPQVQMPSSRIADSDDKYDMQITSRKASNATHTKKPNTKPSLVKTVMGKLRITTEFLKDPDLIDKVESIMATKPKQSNYDPYASHPMQSLKNLSFLHRRKTIDTKNSQHLPKAPPYPTQPQFIQPDSRLSNRVIDPLMQKPLPCTTPTYQDTKSSQNFKIVDFKKKHFNSTSESQEFTSHLNGEFGIGTKFVPS